MKASAYCAIINSLRIVIYKKRSVSFEMFQEPSLDASVGKCHFIDSNMVKGLIGLVYLLLCLDFIFLFLKQLCGPYMESIM